MRYVNWAVQDVVFNKIIAKTRLETIERNKFFRKIWAEDFVNLWDKVGLVENEIRKSIASDSKRGLL